MKSILAVFAICMIGSSASAQPRNCTFDQRETCFHQANELCSGLRDSDNLRKCVGDLSAECTPSASCYPEAMLREMTRQRRLRRHFDPDDDYSPKPISW
jgi:hypothetical protein